MMKPGILACAGLALAAALSFGCASQPKEAQGEFPQPEMLERYCNDKQVSADTPPAFIMANSDDGLVPCENSIRYYEALRAHGVSAALHIYPTGGHGWADHLDFAYREAWMKDLQIWLAGIAGE